MNLTIILTILLMVFVPISKSAGNAGAFAGARTRSEKPEVESSEEHILTQKKLEFQKKSKIFQLEQCDDDRSCACMYSEKYKIDLEKVIPCKKNRSVQEIKKSRLC